MARFPCNFNERKATALDRLRAVAADGCAHCGASLSKLAERDVMLEICADEYLIDGAGDAYAFELLALCPDCHQAHHRDVRGFHDPCPFKARRSRESHDG